MIHVKFDFMESDLHTNVINRNTI